MPDAKRGVRLGKVLAGFLNVILGNLQNRAFKKRDFGAHDSALGLRTIASALPLWKRIGFHNDI